MCLLLLHPLDEQGSLVCLGTGSQDRGVIKHMVHAQKCELFYAEYKYFTHEGLNNSSHYILLLVTSRNCVFNSVCFVRTIAGEYLSNVEKM